MQPFSPEEIARFLAEDVGSGDLTAAIIPEAARAQAELVTRETMVLCGKAAFDMVFRQLDANLAPMWLLEEGETAEAGTLLCQVEGNARALLTGERTALNLLQTLSAVATLSRRYAEAVAGTGCKILDTRKTLPGMRRALKYAVKCGGCENHRIGLFDAILIKENHIVAAGSIRNAVRRAREIAPVPVEIEVENLAELQQALETQPDRIMLDNFSLDNVKTAVELAAGRVELEISGNVGLHNVRLYAETGVDFISVGALTKNLQAVDLSMRFKLLENADG